MSIPRRERRALRRIEAAIRRSDPGLAQLLTTFETLPSAREVSGAPHRRGAAGRALAVSAVRLAGRGAAAAAGAVCAPGLRERLGVRSQPQPLGRAPWQRLT
jgi:Protein of unknown function (DUF3040)